MDKTTTSKTAKASQNRHVYLNEARKTEKEARAFARSLRTSQEVSIIHSPHKDNKAGDYFVTNECPFVRNWETEVYIGPANKA